MSDLLPSRDTCTPNVRVPMVFIVFSRNSWGLYMTLKYPLHRAYLRISHRGMLVGVHPTIVWKKNIFSNTWIRTISMYQHILHENCNLFNMFLLCWVLAAWPLFWYLQSFLWPSFRWLQMHTNVPGRYVQQFAPYAEGSSISSVGLVGWEPQPVDFVEDSNGAGRINEAGVAFPLLRILTLADVDRVSTDGWNQNKPGQWYENSLGCSSWNEG